VFLGRLLKKIFGPKRKEVRESAKENCVMKSFVIVITHQILFGNQIKENGKGGTCGEYGEEQKCLQGFGGET
jgi:hypothetical protein